MPNLSKDEILKALYCCKLSNEDGCLNCPLSNISLPECNETLLELAIDLIEVQEQVINTLKYRMNVLIPSHINKLFSVINKDFIVGRILYALSSGYDIDNRKNLEEFADYLYNEILKKLVDNKGGDNK